MSRINGEYIYKDAMDVRTVNFVICNIYFQFISYKNSFVILS